ncbi:MAG: hypothetical protein AB1454_05970 [Candidatus Auribacterota bacterium]|jgi:hypothetical protein|uniref:DUF3267 domain-containing protein n=1 Tax=Candidatus Auribacter fodinae TaxID=2093366 RepID=A0A3A4R3D4_9BACT|nr:MAG: hypothetical protein C4541_05965 [Candidatus Auribacter fodinae]
MTAIYIIITVACGLILLPLCWASSVIAYTLVFASKWHAASFFSGVICAGILSVFRGYGSRAYIILHEMNHAFWCLLVGIPIKKIVVTAKGGYIDAEREHLLVALAPYFFPLPMLLLLFAHSIIVLFGVWHRPVVYIEYCFTGLLIARHVIDSVNAIMDGQIEINRFGLFFSLSCIYSLLFLWSGLFLSIFLADFYLADFIVMSYKQITLVYHNFFHYICLP